MIQEGRMHAASPEESASLKTSSPRYGRKTPESSRQSAPSPLSIHTSLYQDSSDRCRSSLNSSVTDTDVCRICHGGRGVEPLLSVCYCSGSMGKIHLSCIQHWLGSSNKSRCEICDFQFTVQRKTKPFKQFLKNPGSPQDKKHLKCDIMCFLLLTPLSWVTSALCIHGAIHFPFTSLQITGLYILAFCLMILYVSWLAVCLHHNIKLWKDWKQFNQDVKLKCEPPNQHSNRTDTSICGKLPNSSLTLTGVRLQSIEIPVHRHFVPNASVSSLNNKNKKDIGIHNATVWRKVDGGSGMPVDKTRMSNQPPYNDGHSSSKAKQITLKGTSYQRSERSCLGDRPSDKSLSHPVANISTSTTARELFLSNSHHSNDNRMQANKKTSSHSSDDDTYKLTPGVRNFTKRRCDSWNVSRISHSSSESSTWHTDPELVSINFSRKNNKHQISSGSNEAVSRGQDNPKPQFQAYNSLCPQEQFPISDSRTSYI